MALLRLAAFVAALVWPAAAGAGLFNAETFRLDNGLEVVVLPDHRTAAVTQMVWYKAGAADEVVGNGGVAHFLEHLMFKGTPRHPGGEITRWLQQVGGTQNAFTSADVTVYHQTVAREHLETAMAFEADRMINLKLAPKDIETERQVIIEERRLRVDNSPVALLREQMDALQYLEHPYGRPTIGWRHEMERLDRAKAIDFYRRHYAPNNATLVLAGDITGTEGLRLARKHYGRIKPARLAPRQWAAEPPSLGPRRTSFADPNARQARFIRQYRAPSAAWGETRLTVPLHLLSDIIGEGSNSRLYKRLVKDKGLAVQVSCGYSALSLGPSQMVISAWPADGVAMDVLEAEIDAVLADLLAGGVQADELSRVQASATAQAIYLRDDIVRAANLFGDALLVGLTPADIESWPSRVEAATADDLMAAARHVLRPEGSVTGLLLAAPQGAKP